jgi:hypothetical protein
LPPVVPLSSFDRDFQAKSEVVEVVLLFPSGISTTAQGLT